MSKYTESDKELDKNFRKAIAIVLAFTAVIYIGFLLILL